MGNKICQCFKKNPFKEPLNSHGDERSLDQNTRKIIHPNNAYLIFYKIGFDDGFFGKQTTNGADYLTFDVVIDSNKYLAYIQGYLAGCRMINLERDKLEL